MRPVILGILLGLLTLVAWVSTAEGEDNSGLRSKTSQAPRLSTIPPDSRIRLSAPSLEIERREVSLVETVHDSICVDFGDRKDRWIPLASLTAFEVARVDRDRRRNAVIYGVLLGGVSGGALGYSLAENRSSGGFGVSLNMSKDAGGTFGVLAGMVIGGTLGSLIGSKMASSWEPVYYRVGEVSVRTRLDPGRSFVGLITERQF